MEEIIKTDEESQKELSRKVQEFKLTDFYQLLAGKLAVDYKRLVNDLIVKDNPEVRGAIHYLLGLYDWFESRSELEELINIEKRKIEEDRDW